MTKRILIFTLFLGIIQLGFAQKNKMIIPDLKGKIVQKNAGSVLLSTPCSGKITPSAITENWGVELTNYGAFHHTSKVDTKSFELLKNKANERQNQEFKPTPNTNLRQDSLMPFLNKNFRGNQRETSVPMDNTVAVSRNGFIVSGINTNVIFTQPDGKITFTKTLSDFFFLLNLGTRMYDPRAIYDTEENKFIFMCLHGSDPASTQLCIAFSETEDPNGNWHFYKVDGNPGDNNNWFDYPNVSVSTHDYYVAGLMRNPAGDWQYSVLYQMDKKDGFEGKPLRWKHYNQLFDADEKPSFNLVPTPSGWSDLIGPGMFFVSNEPLGGNTYNLYYTDESLHNDPVLFSLQSEGLPTSLAPDGRQKGINDRLNTFDSRIWSAMYLNGVIHMGSHVNTENGDVGLFYGRMDVNTQRVDAEVLHTPGIDYGFPSFSSFGHNPESDTVLVNYIYTGPNEFPGQQQRICAGRGNQFDWSLPTTLKTGITSINVLQENRERWGDYTTAVRRYTGNRIESWVTGCFGEGGSYGTWLGQYLSEKDTSGGLVAEFVADKTITTKNTNVVFTDISDGEADEKTWYFENGTPSTSTASSPVVTWNENGAYNVKLVIKKGVQKDSITKTAYIHISEPETLPVANFSFDRDTVFRQDSVQFFNLSSDNTTLLKWNFVLGSPGASSDQNPKVRYNTRGQFPVTLTALNIAGQDIKTVSKAITVIDRFAPTAIFSSNTTTIMPGENVLFSDLSTGGPTSWEWTFEGGNPATSTVKNPTISYPTEGVFSVSLKVKNNAGENEVTKNQFITVGSSSVQNDGDIVLSKLYPNPVATNERVNIHFTIKKAGVYYCDILDNNGRVIKSIWKDKIKSGENVMEFNTSHLSSGTYYFNIRNVDGKQLTLPFVVW